MIPDRIRFDQPQPGLQRLAARFGGHAFDAHRHETYAVGLTLWGAQSFHYRGSLRTSVGGQVMVLHPDETHDGHAGVEEGFGYRMLYVDPGLIDGLPFVPEGVVDDPALSEIVQEAFVDFPQALEPLAADALIARLGDALAERSDAPPAHRTPRIAERGVQHGRAFLIAEAHRTVSSEELERVSGLDRFAFSRHFRAAFGTSPHRFQVGRRLDRARSLIADGVPLSEAAAAAGFADQSHLTRHFAARFGLTPGRWASLGRRDAGR